MTWEISKEFAFSASHQLDGLALEHPCGRLHGHNYVARVELAGEELDPHGFILDYGDLAPFRRWVDAYLDHRHLNEVPELAGYNPTAEHLAAVLHGVLLSKVAIPANVAVSVAVSETPKTWARWTP